MRNIMGTRKTTLTDRQYSYQPARLAWPILFRGRENVVNGFATPELIDEPENQVSTPVLELDPVWVRARVDVMRTRMVQVRHKTVLEEIGSWLPLQSTPEQIHRPTT